jgi:putative ATP-binding cassette transporter
MGPSGIGKSSLLRVLGQLWPLMFNKNARKPPSLVRSHNVFFLAQRPYMIRGSLRQQVSYPIWKPTLASELSDEIMERLFRECNLQDVWELRRHELDSQDLAWEHRLSLGEQQRLQFVRLLWHFEWHQKYGDVSQGFFAVLDEATAALDMDSEMAVYDAIKRAKIGYLSVAHRPTVIPYHTKVLLFEKDPENPELPPTYEIKPSSAMAHQAACKMTEHLAPEDKKNA